MNRCSRILDRNCFNISFDFGFSSVLPLCHQVKPEHFNKKSLFHWKIHPSFFVRKLIIIGYNSDEIDISYEKYSDLVTVWSGTLSTSQMMEITLTEPINIFEVSKRFSACGTLTQKLLFLCVNFYMKKKQQPNLPPQMTEIMWQTTQCGAHLFTKYNGQTTTLSYFGYYPVWIMTETLFSYGSKTI